MKSNLKLYYNTIQKPWNLESNKLFMIDDFDTYLNQKESITILDFQYIKNQMSLEIKIDLSQYYCQPLHEGGIRYVAITDQEENKTYFYYVTKSEWRSYSCVKLMLTMDVLNTFKINRDYKFTERSKIKREHKDRVSKAFEYYYQLIGALGHEFEGTIVVGNRYTFHDYTSGSNFTAKIIKYEYNPQDFSLDIVFILDYGQTIFHVASGDTIRIFDATNFVEVEAYDDFFHREGYFRKINLSSENINPVLYKTDNDEYVRDNIDCDWFLVYRNQNDPSESLVNPVDAFIVPSIELECDFGQSIIGGRLTADNLENGKEYRLQRLINEGTTNVTLDNGVSIDIFTDLVVNQSIRFYRYYDTIIIDVDAPDTTSSFYGHRYATKTLTISPMPCAYNFRNLNSQDIIWQNGTWTNQETSVDTLDSIEAVDKTDSKYIKILKLPYIPSDFSINDGKLVIEGSDYEHTTITQSGGGVLSVLRLKNLNKKFKHSMKTQFNPLSNLIVAIPNPSLTDLRDNTNESKIYHSEFYMPKMIYDSFSFTFQLERVNVEKWYEEAESKELMSIEFVTTSTINSRFLFKYIDYKCDKLASQDYDNICVVARNNDVTLYNQQYINYLRNGYNYDVKSKNRAIASSWFSTGLGIVSTAVGIGLSATGVGTALGVPMIVGGITSTATSLKSAITTQQQQEQNLQQKQQQLEAQATSVSGSDDVDLMSDYSQNRLKYVVYKPSQITLDMLFDLFYYIGYNTNEFKIPMLDTRVWFNYIEMESMIEVMTNIPSDCMSEIHKCFNEGVTIMHKNMVNGVATWDIEQQHENYESWLF